MTTISIREMRSALGRLDELVERAGELIVTRHGKPVARILPLEHRREMPSHAVLRARTVPLAQGSETLVRQDRDERG